MLISESFAKRKFPNQDPLGQRVRIGPDIGHADRPWGTIVGVVGDVRQASLALSDSDAFYTSSTQWSWVDNVQSLVVRTKVDAAALAPAIRDAIWSVDKDQPIVRVATMDSLLARSEAERRFVLILFEAFGLVALALAATGIYGVLSGSVCERTREIGVRVALGATPGDILALVVRQGMTLTVLGLLIGLSGAVVASQALVTLLFGVSRLDPVTYVGVIALLAGSVGDRMLGAGVARSTGGSSYHVAGGIGSRPSSTARRPWRRHCLRRGRARRFRDGRRDESFRRSA